ncbi:PH domain-containing protein [Micromonospora chersina]
MGSLEIVLAVVLGLVVNEMTDVSPWLGRLLATWSARLRYQNLRRAEIRAEELAAVINDRPGKLLKLGTGLGFLGTALLARLRHLVAGEPERADDPSDLLGSRRILPLEDEPTRAVARYLFPTERFRGEWRRHWIHAVKRIAIVIIYAVLGVWAATERIKPQYETWVIVAVVALAVLLTAHRVLAWYVGRFVVTNKRLMVTEGVFFRRVAMMPLLRVVDMRYNQTPAGRLLNYGTFELESAGRRNALRQIVELPNPNELYLRIIEEMYEPEAVEARLGSDWPSSEIDPIAVITSLSHELARLTTAIKRLDPTPEPEPEPSYPGDLVDEPIIAYEPASEQVSQADPPPPSNPDEPPPWVNGRELDDLAGGLDDAGPDHDRPVRRTRRLFPPRSPRLRNPSPDLPD